MSSSLSYFDQIPSDKEKFIFIMSGNSGDSEIMKLVTQYIWDAYNKRKI